MGAEEQAEWDEGSADGDEGTGKAVISMKVHASTW